MSYFDDASLVMIPSGYKTSKVYSVKPTDGTGDLTFTRSNDTATRVNSAGLIEKVRTNLALYSQDFTNAVWYKEVGNSATANTIANPLNGAVDADTITATDTNAINVNQLFTAAVTSEHTYSVYLKKNNHDLIQPYIFSSGTFAARIEINLNDGTFTTINGSGATVTSVGNGWYRVTLIASFSSSATFTTGLLTTSTTGSRSVYIFGAQLETGVATDYIATTSAAVSVGPVANVPRLDYLGSSCPRLLLEPQRTNLVTYSEQFNNAAWTKDPLGGAALTTVVTANQAVSPDGYTNADKVFMSLGGGTTTSDWARLQSAAFNVTSGTAYTITFWAWASQSSEVGKKVRVGVGANTALLDFTLTAAAQRFSVTYTAASTGTDSLLFQIRGAQGLSSTAEFFLWGAQLEAGSYATSYIPTLGAAVTRGADAASKTGISSLIGQTEGTVYFEIQLPNPAAEGGRVLMQIGNAPERIYFAKDSNTQNIFQLATQSSAGYNFVNTSNVTTSTVKMAIAYKSGQNAFYLNGTLISTASATANPTSISQIVLGEPLFGNSETIVKQALLFKTRLTNAQLTELTTL